MKFANIISLISNFGIILIIIVFIFNKLGIIPEATKIFIHKTLSKDTLKTNELQKELFERKYYKDISNDKIVKLLEDWHTLLFDMDHSFLVYTIKSKYKTEEEIKKENIIKMHQRMIMFCSSKTLKLYAQFMQMIYKIDTDNTEYKEEDIVNLYFVALLISRIKYDYSGDFTEPLDILKVKLKDIDNYNEQMIKFRKDFKEYIEN